MIRYAEMRDMPIVEGYEHCIRRCDLKDSVAAKRILVMFREDAFVGWLRFNLFWDNTPFINMLYLLEGYRGRGYGKQLVAYWEKEMAKAQYGRVLTSTLSTERAQFFFRKNGYIDCGSLLLPGEPLEIILSKDLEGDLLLSEKEI